MAGCRRFRDAAGVNAANFDRREHLGHQRFWAALGELRILVGQQVGLLATPTDSMFRTNSGLSCRSKATTMRTTRHSFLGSNDSLNARGLECRSRCGVTRIPLRVRRVSLLLKPAVRLCRHFGQRASGRNQGLVGRLQRRTYGGGPAGSQVPQLAKACRQQLGHRAGRYVEQVRRLSVGESAEDAQRQARALELGELAEPPHDRGQVGPARMVPPGLPGCAGTRDAPGNAGCPHATRHRSRGRGRPSPESRPARLLPRRPGARTRARRRTHRGGPTPSRGPAPCSRRLRSRGGVAGPGLAGGGSQLQRAAPPANREHRRAHRPDRGSLLPVPLPTIPLP